jgi:hypothetical protein
MGLLMATSGQLRRLQKRLAKIPKDVKTAVVPALAASGEELADRIRALAPEDSGDLKDSVAVTLPGQSTPPFSQPGGSRVAGENEVLITVGNEDVRYAALVEYGTAPHSVEKGVGTKLGRLVSRLSGTGEQHPGSEAQPYFWPAWRLTRKRIANRVKRAIGKAVRDGASK